jgi:hypothetical protein
MTSYHNDVSDALLLQTTRALTKFVREHDGVQLPFLERMVALLEAGGFDDVAKQFKKVHFGAYGFGDWFPPVVFPHEDADYVQAVFESLVERWSRLMTAAVGGAK